MLPRTPRFVATLTNAVRKAAPAATLALATACIPAFPDYDRPDHPAKDFDGDGMVEADGDCDDQDPTTYAGADEVCDGKDNNCDALVDNDAIDETPWYFDGDGDGYGLAATEKLACDPPLQPVRAHRRRLQ